MQCFRTTSFVKLLMMPIKTTTYLHNIKEHLLSQTILLLKELMLRVSPGNVPADEFFTRRGHLQQFGVLFLYGQILGVA